jgi:polyhydroxyalkanoate synthase
MLEEDPERWLASAGLHKGSWWPHWSRWLAPFGGRRISAPAALGNRRHRVIEPAPGRYVREKCA